MFCSNTYYCTDTSHSAYDATSTELYGVKIDGFLYPNFIQIPKKEAKSSSTVTTLFHENTLYPQKEAGGGGGRATF